MRFSIIQLAVLGLSAVSTAHVVITTPTPFKESQTDPETGGFGNGPLKPDGSNFPCKTSGGYTAQGPAAVYPLGSTQPLSFQGTAVHGGGSCQISITYDKAPNKNSVFKVIHSIEGACPMRNIQGNNDAASGGAFAAVPDQYSFTVPEGLPTGDAIVAWTWFNTIGNREMYMNCAPITITGGATRRDEDNLVERNATELIQRDVSFYNSLPNIYKANIGNGCATVEQTHVKFPNPGSSVETGTQGFYKITAVSETCKQINGGSDSAPAPSQPASSVVAPPASSTSTPPKATLPGGVFRPTKGEENPTATATSTPPASSSAPGTTAIVVPTPTAQPTTLTVIPTKASSVAPPAGTGSPQSGALSGPCSEEGVWNCIGGTSFQRCASGTWSVVQSVAAGTTCGADGQTNNFAIAAIGGRDSGKRSGSRRALHRAHIRHHIRSS